MKKTKKAFTLMEMLVVLMVSAMLFVLLFTLLAKTTNVYNKATSSGDQGYAVVMIADIETLSRGCDYVTIENDYRTVVFYDGGERYAIDANDYGVDAKMTVNNNTKLISVYIGGEVYCVTYVQNTPS